MPPSPPDPPYYRRTGTAFEPRFTLGILYLFGFFFLYCFVLISPALIDVLQNVPTGPEQEEAARRVAQDAMRPRLWIAGVLSALTTVGGAHYHVLPGFRQHR